MIKFAGVGSREVPIDMFSLMVGYTKRLLALNAFLVSGGARKKKGAGSDVFSADEMFEELYRVNNGDGIIVVESFSKRCKMMAHLVGSSLRVGLPNEHLMGKAKQYYIENNIIPHLQKIGDYGKLLHYRNFYQILSPSPDGFKLVDFVLCYAPLVDGEPKGGTRTAIKVAEKLGVPVFNLAKPADQWKFESYLTELEDKFYGKG